VRPFGHNRHGPKTGDYDPWGGTAGSPSNTMTRAKPTLTIWHLYPCSRLATTHWPKLWGAVPPFFGGRNRAPHSTECRQGRGLPPDQMASRSIQPFGHNRHWPKIGGCAHLGEGELGRSPSNKMWPGARHTPQPSGILIHPAVLSQQTHGRKLGQCPFKGRGAGFPSNTMWPGQRPTSMRSFTLIRPSVWPQYTNATDKTGQTDNGLTG